MKKLMMLTDESILAGCARSGVAEVADSLANAMAADYAVSVVCPDGDGAFVRMAANLRQVADGVRACRLFGVDYYLLRRWPEGLDTVVEAVGPDVLHNFAAPELLGALPTRPARCVYTIDQADFVRGRETALLAYDAVTTVSGAYAAELLAGGDALAETLAGMDFRGITNGILEAVFAPEKGLLVPARYTAEDQGGKAACKERLLRTYGIQGDPCLYLMMCRLVRDKGLDDVLEAVHTIRDSGGFAIIVGRGEKVYEDKLAALTRADGVLWVKQRPSPMQAIPARGRPAPGRPWQGARHKAPNLTRGRRAFACKSPPFPESGSRRRPQGYAKAEPGAGYRRFCLWSPPRRARYGRRRPRRGARRFPCRRSRARPCARR